MNDLLGCFMGVSWRVQGCFKGASRVLQGCLKGDSQSILTDITNTDKESVSEISAPPMSGRVKGHFGVVSRRFHCCFSVSKVKFCYQFKKVICSKTSSIMQEKGTEDGHTEKSSM